jgi:outer membrane receptor protein involved in Fe transport
MPTPTTTLLIAHLLAASGTDAPPPDAQVVDLEEQVVVLPHYSNGVGTSDAASSGTVTHQLIEERPILRPGEVLELVPGVIITQHSGAGKANQYFLRGFNLDHGTDFATTLDGMPINLRTHAHGQGYTDLNFLIPELIGDVQYFKGPYFAAKGDFASAGAADIHYATDLPETVATMTGGTFGYGRALVAGASGIGGGHLLYGLELMHEDGPWVHPDDYRKLNAVLRYTGNAAGARWSVTAMAYEGTWHATDQIPERAVQDGSLDRFGTVDPTSGGDSFRYSLSGNWHQPLRDGSLDAAVYAVRYRLNLFSNFTYFLQDPVHGDQMLQSDDRWQYGTSGTWAHELSVGGVPNTLRAGWDARVDRILPVALYHTEARSILETVRRDDVTETSAGLFAEVETRWTAWFRSLAGVRYDQYWFDVSSEIPANSGNRTAGRASPKVSAILGPWAKTELFVNYGLGFHSNDARGVTMTVDPVDHVTPVSPVTPLVRTRGDEIGVRTEVIPGLQASVAFWELVMGSELLFTGDAGTTEPSRPSLRRGVEASAHWSPLRWLLLDLDAAFSRARFTNAEPVGDRIPGSIGTAVSAGLTVQEVGPLTASVFLRYFGPRPLVEDGSVESSASTLLNAQVTYRLGKHLRFTGEVFNLLDARVDDIAYYYRSRLPGERLTGVDDVHFHPAEPRSFRISVSLVL